MKTIEQFRAEQLAALEKSTAAHAVMLERAGLFAAAGLPIPEYIADGNLYGAICVTYQNPKSHNGEQPRSMSQAVEMFAQFVNANTVMPFHVLKDGSSTLTHPEERMPAKKQESQYSYKRDAYKNAGYAAMLEVHHMAESHNTSAQLEFFSTLGGKLFKVSIDFGQGYIGTCPQLAPRGVVTRGYRNVIESRTYQPADVLSGLYDGMLSYSYGGDSGPVKTGADHRFLFVADHDENAPVECSHAVAQLETLAAMVDGTAKKV